MVSMLGPPLFPWENFIFLGHVFQTGFDLDPRNLAAGNHYILHHLDYYLMRKNKEITEDYLPKQMKFWKDMEDTMNLLESELTVYTRLLPAENSLGIPTRALFNKVLANMEALKDRREASQDFLPRKLLSDQHHPIYLVNRLLEEVKPPPPFIPTLTRRHSFS